MSAGAKRLHPSYAAFWAAHVVWLLAMLIFFPPLWLIRVHLGFFAIVEGIAVAVRRGKAGDTLSEFVQAIAAKTPAGFRVRWYQSWKAVVTLLAALYALEGGYLVYHTWGWPLAALVTILVFLWLMFHWSRTEKYG